MALRPREGRARGHALRPAAARRSRQGAAAHRAPGPRAHPDLPRGRRAQEPRADRRDRRRVARDLLLPRAREGVDRPHRGRPREGRQGHGPGFDVVPTVPVVVGDDLEACAAPMRQYAALYVGGMGSREQNFYNQPRRADGLRGGGRKVQDLYLARQHRDAAEAVPFEFIDRTSLIGPRGAHPRPAGGVRRGGRDDAGRRVVRREPRRAGRHAADGVRGARRVRPGGLTARVLVVRGRGARPRPGADRVPADQQQRAPAHRRRARRLGGPGRRVHGRDPARHRGRRPALLPPRHREHPADVEPVAVPARAARRARRAHGLVRHRRHAAHRRARAAVPGHDRGHVPQPVAHRHDPRRVRRGPRRGRATWRATPSRSNGSPSRTRWSTAARRRWP